MELKEKLKLAFRNTEEVLTNSELEQLVKSGEEFTFYFGIAPTGPFHLGYLIPLAKMLDLIEIGGNAKILLADYHAFLDDRKTPWEEMKIRTDYIETCFKIALSKNYKKVKFVRGSEFQTKKEYIEDLFLLSSMVTAKRAIRAASEVVRIKESPLVSSLLYPLMQILDVKYLECDVALGGIDQRHIYALGRETLEKVGWKKPICVFTPLITSLRGPGTKMSASLPNTHISFHDSEDKIKEKIRKAYCPERETKANPVFEIAKYILLPIFGALEFETRNGKLKVESVEELEKNYKEGKIHPLDLKETVSRLVNEVVKPVREYFEKEKDFYKKVKESMKKSGYVMP